MKCMIFDMYQYVYTECIQYTIHWNKANVKKFSSDKINGTKKAPCFLSRAPIHYSFTFNLRFLYEPKDKVCLSKTMWDFPFSIPFRSY